MSEAVEQTHVVKYCAFKKIPIFAIPNGGSRNKLEAKNLKMQGVKAGVPDLFIPVARGNYHGLFIEMKYGKNKTTALQEEWLELLNKNGYCAAVCYGFDKAQTVIDWYMGGAK
jgi:hypothetical protein